MPSGGENDQPRANGKQRKSNAESKHWLEYAIFVFVILTAAATGCAAWYARQQWLTAFDAEQRSLRAYVSLGADHPIMYSSQKMVITIENYGQTPAENVRAFSSWEFLPFGQALPDDFGFPDKAGCGMPASQHIRPSVGMLMPKIPMPSSHAHCPDELANLIKAEQQQINAWLYGEIRYFDVFNKPRLTTFCMLYWPSEATNVYCDRHNEVDPKS